MRPMTHVQIALTACTTIAGLVVSGCEAQVPAFDGTYTVTLQGHILTLTLRTVASGDVVGRIRGGGAVLELNGRSTTDEDGDVSLEGILTGPGGRSDFALFPDDEGAFGLLLTPYDASGVPRTDLASIYAVSRISDAAGDLADMDGAAKDLVPAAPSPAQAVGDERLVGTWATQVIMTSEVGGVATQLRMQLSADGTMRDLGSRSMGDIAGGIFDIRDGTGAEHAIWRTEGDVIWTSYAGSQWIPFARFQLSGTQLLLTYLHDGSRQLWSRVTGD
jgi:hypothetical protein